MACLRCLHFLPVQAGRTRTRWASPEQLSQLGSHRIVVFIARASVSAIASSGSGSGSVGGSSGGGGSW